MADVHSDQEERTSWWQLIKSCSGTARDRRNQYWFVAWILTWAVSFEAVNFAFRSDLSLSTQVSWFIAIIPIAIGVGAFLAYLKFLTEADEMLQQIQLKGLAIGFGIGAVAGLAYPLLENVGAPDMKLDDLVAVMMFGWVAGQFIALRSYR